MHIFRVIAIWSGKFLFFVVNKKFTWIQRDFFPILWKTWNLWMTIFSIFCDIDWKNILIFSHFQHDFTWNLWNFMNWAKTVIYISETWIREMLKIAFTRFSWTWIYSTYLLNLIFILFFFFFRNKMERITVFKKGSLGITANIFQIMNWVFSNKNYHPKADMLEANV